MLLGFFPSLDSRREHTLGVWLRGYVRFREIVEKPGHALQIPAELEKGHKDRLMAMAPEFVQFLMATPPSRRHGYVFIPQAIRADRADSRLGTQPVQRVIGIVGRLAGVKVNERFKGDAVQVKYASAYELRRTLANAGRPA